MLSKQSSTSMNLVEQAQCSQFATLPTAACGKADYACVNALHIRQSIQASAFAKVVRHCNARSTEEGCKMP